jgi:hypothetical protein
MATEGKAALKCAGSWWKVALFTYWYVMAACGGNTPPSPEDAGGTGGGPAGGGAGGGGVDAGPTIGVQHQALSGSRLKTRVITGDDGSQVYAGMFDSTRGEPCAFQLAGDGVTRCLPSARPTAITYSDAACTVPVFRVTEAECAPKYAVDSASLATCPLYWRLHDVTAIATPPAAYSNASGLCQALPVVVDGGWYSYGAELDAGLFVGGTEALQ